MAKKNSNPLDALKMVFGSVGGKHKKRKTKCQQKKLKLGLRDRLTHALGYVKGYSIRQVSRRKFIVTAPVHPTEPRGVSASVYDYKRDTITLIEKGSKIGWRFA